LPALFLFSAFFVVPFGAGVFLGNPWGWPVAVQGIGLGLVLIYGLTALLVALRPSR